jgi:hypothetical protein
MRSVWCADIRGCGVWEEGSGLRREKEVGVEKGEVRCVR